MRRFVFVAVLLLPLCGALGVSAAPQREEQRPTISVETNLVMVPVSVVDRKGEPVTGLSGERFTVYDEGEPQAIQFFTSDEVPATVGLVIDCSTSMTRYRPSVTAAGAAFARSGHPLDEMFTVNFNEVVWPGLPGGVRFAQSVDQLERALARAPARGMTALFDAIDRGMDYLESATWERRALILVSDGGDNASRATLDAVLDRARRSNVVIYSVMLADSLTHDPNPRVLKTLAQETGGYVFVPQRLEDVTAAFTRIAAELRTSYMLGFSPPSAAASGYRAIHVQATAADGRRLTVRARAGYYAGRLDD